MVNTSRWVAKKHSGYLSELFPLGMGRNSGYLSEYLTLHCLLRTPISDLEVCENGQGRIPQRGRTPEAEFMNVQFC
jgi:hypothetical protein